MTDFQIRSDHVDVEQIMRQIRSRIREKRGVDYTEEEIRELANVRLEKFLDPRGVRSDLIEQFRRKREATLPPNYKFEDSTIYETHRGFLRFLRKLLNPILKLFFNPQPIADALHIQAKLNAQQAALEPLYYEVIHNLVVETTRLESMSSRLDFDERRARALEGVVQYRAGAVPPLQPQPSSGGDRAGAGAGAAQQERRNRRRRRRGRRGGSQRDAGSGQPGDPNAERSSDFARAESSAGYVETPRAEDSGARGGPDGTSSGSSDNESE